MPHLQPPDLAMEQEAAGARQDGLSDLFPNSRQPSPQRAHPDVPSYLVKRWDGVRFDLYDTRLETWDDPTPRELECAVYDFDAAFAKACEELVRQEEEHDRKSLMIALEVYSTQHNIQPSDLEFLEVKERNIMHDEDNKGYLHFNFFVKGLDGKHTMFFAEVHHNLKDEKDVYLCTPLGEDDFKASKANDQARCKACQDQAKDLIHPSCGRLLGGQDEEPDEDYFSW